MKLKVEELIAKGYIQKRVMWADIVDFDMDGIGHCICGIADSVEEMEELVECIKDRFQAKKVIFHNLSAQTATLVIKVKSGTKGDIHSLNRTHPDNKCCCGIFPLINVIVISIDLLIYVLL